MTMFKLQKLPKIPNLFSDYVILMIAEGVYKLSEANIVCYCGLHDTTLYLENKD